MATTSTERSASAVRDVSVKQSGRTYVPPSSRDWTRALLPLLAAFLLAVAAWWVAVPLAANVMLGLDFGGGVAPVFSVSSFADDAEPDAETVASAAAVLGKRLQLVGMQGYRIEHTGDAVTVYLPEGQPAQTVADCAAVTGELEFFELARVEDAETLARVRAQGSGVILPAGSYTAFMTGADVKSAEAVAPESDGGNATINLTLTEEGKRAFGEISARLAPSAGVIGVALDGVVITAPSVTSAITNGAVTLSGSFDYDQAKVFAAAIESGVLPVTLSSSGSERVGPLAGEGTLGRVLVGSGIALLLLAAASAVRLKLAALAHAIGLAAYASYALAGVVLLGRFLGAYLDFAMLAALIAGAAALEALVVLLHARTVAHVPECRDAVFALREGYGGLWLVPALLALLACILVPVGSLLAWPQAVRSLFAGVLAAACSLTLAWLLAVVPFFSALGLSELLRNPGRYGIPRRAMRRTPARGGDAA